jgi:hypothetical protein
LPKINASQAKELNMIDNRFNLSLKDCRKLLDREDVNNRLIEFGEIHDDVIFNKFNVASLPASFTLVNKLKKTGKDDAAIDPKKTLKSNYKKTLAAKESAKEAMKARKKMAAKRKLFA